MAYYTCNALPSDVFQVKKIAQKWSDELGFVNLAALRESEKKGYLMVAKDDEGDRDAVLGFAEYYIRRDKTITIYHIGVRPPMTRKGIGMTLMNGVKKVLAEMDGFAIQLKCPAGLFANKFYEKSGFILSDVTKTKKGRALNIWRWARKTQKHPYSKDWDFYASININPTEFKKLWAMVKRSEAAMTPTKSLSDTHPKPLFKNLLVTPIHEDKSVRNRKLIHLVKSLKNTGAVDKVFFDSGGYNMQTGGIPFSEIGDQLLKTYVKHQWADVYCLPDLPIVRGDTYSQVWSKVVATVTGSVKLYGKLPPEIQEKSLGVLIGKDKAAIDFCIDEYLTHFKNGVGVMGFGAFPTGSGKAANVLNLVNEETLRLIDHIIKRLDKHGIGLHVFGISTPPAISLLLSLGVSSLDSSGWMAAGGFGMVHFPFTSSQAVSPRHLRLEKRKRRFINKRELDALKTETGHTCPFCEDYEKILHGRQYRVLHNLSVLTNLQPYEDQKHRHFFKRGTKYRKMIDSIQDLLVGEQKEQKEPTPSPVVEDLQMSLDLRTASVTT